MQGVYKGACPSFSHIIMQKRVFIIYCWEGTPNSRWYPWLKGELIRRDFDAKVPTMPNTNHPRQAAWLKHMETVIGAPDKNTYLVGHSVGCIAILRYLEGLKKGQIVGGVVLVAGYTSDLGYYDLKSFFTKDVQWKKIRSHCNKFAAIHSDNDQYVSLHYAEFFKKKLNAEVIVEHKKGHFSIGDGNTLPDALKSILKFSRE